MLKANYHTHTKLCRHAIGEVIDYVKVAYECGFSEIGISDHAPYLERFMTKEEFKRSRLDTGAMDFNELDEYFHQIKEAKIKYLKDRFPDIEVVTVYKDRNKSDAVLARGAVLVDDFTDNLDLWNEALGVSVKFSNKDKEYNYIRIDSLDKLIDIFPKLETLVKEKLVK